MAILTRDRFRRYTSAQWAQHNPVLLDGEPGWDSTAKQLKIGNGVQAWADLDWYAGTGGGGTGVTDGDKGSITVSGTGTVWDLDDNAVTTAKIADNAVTTAKIGANQVTGAKFADNSITGAKFADGAVTTAKIADGAVTAIKIPDGTVPVIKLIPSEIAEYVQDTVAAMIAAGVHNAITVNYDDTAGSLSFIYTGGVGSGLTLDDMPSGYTHEVRWNGSSWPATRPSTRTDIYMHAIGNTTSPSWIDDVPGDYWDKEV